MFSQHIGEFAALTTAVFWTITALAFTDAGKKIGSLAVNFWRLILGLIFLSIFTFVYYGSLFPTQIPLNATLWLAGSGFIGIFLGDLFLFEAFVLIGPRISLLIMSLSPPIAAGFSWIFRGETMSVEGLIGMMITLTGIIIVVLQGKNASQSGFSLGFRFPLKGIIFALLGAVGQAGGLVMSKVGVLASPNAFSATQIRVIAGTLGFVVFIFLIKKMAARFFILKSCQSHGRG